MVVDATKVRSNTRRIATSMMFLLLYIACLFGSEVGTWRTKVGSWNLADVISSEDDAYLKQPASIQGNAVIVGLNTVRSEDIRQARLLELDLKSYSLTFLDIPSDIRMISSVASSNYYHCISGALENTGVSSTEYSSYAIFCRLRFGDKWEEIKNIVEPNTPVDLHGFDGTGKLMYSTYGRLGDVDPIKFCSVSLGEPMNHQCVQVPKECWGISKTEVIEPGEVIIFCTVGPIYIQRSSENTIRVATGTDPYLFWLPLHVTSDDIIAISPEGHALSVSKQHQQVVENRYPEVARYKKIGPQFGLEAIYALNQDGCFLQNLSKDRSRREIQCWENIIPIVFLANGVFYSAELDTDGNLSLYKHLR